jgi:hypothetical protein
MFVIRDRRRGADEEILGDPGIIHAGNGNTMRVYYRDANKLRPARKNGKIKVRLGSCLKISEGFCAS